MSALKSATVSFIFIYFFCFSFLPSCYISSNSLLAWDRYMAVPLPMLIKNASIFGLRVNAPSSDCVAFHLNFFLPHAPAAFPVHLTVRSSACTVHWITGLLVCFQLDYTTCKIQDCFSYVMPCKQTTLKLSDL